ncbi:hypothetical protein [Dactylosporangium sp. NPDC048998]|uniref:hypothetical protein n=1 Tax=Dactylosporangium sp. NPDC048998 TaxID=3363976 RepID=UPI00371E5C8E
MSPRPKLHVINRDPGRPLTVSPQFTVGVSMVRGLHALLTWLNTPERLPPYIPVGVSLAEAIDFADDVAGSSNFGGV